MNQVQLVGIVATDITVKEFAGRETGEVRVKASFLLAVRRPVADKTAAPDWIRVDVWGVQARYLAQYNSKGSKVGVAGRLRGDFYNPDGGERGGQLRTVVVADRIDYLTQRRPAADAPAEGEGDAAAPVRAATGSRR